MSTSRSWQLAYTVTSPECGVIAPLGYQAPFQEALARVAMLGYDGVEIQVRDAADDRAQQVGAHCENAGLAIAALATGPMNTEDGLTLSDYDPGTRRAAYIRLCDIVDLACALEVPVTLGSARGDGGTVSDHEGLAWAIDMIVALGARAHRGGQFVLVEPQSVGTFIRTSADAIERFGPPAAWPLGVALLLDQWHAAQTGEDSSDFWRATGDLVRHLQFAGPARGPLIADPTLVDALRAAASANYTGWITAEHRQLPDRDAAAGQSLKAFRWASAILTNEADQSRAAQ